MRSPLLLRVLIQALAIAGASSSGAQELAPAGKSGLEWVAVPGGTFTMGSKAPELTWSRPQHRVSVKAFELAKTPATFKQYRACVDAGGCTPAHVSDGTCFTYSGEDWVLGVLPASFQGDDQPVVCVDWRQAKAFAAWAGGRLPTEAEWEYAARGAGKDQKYPWGDEPATCERAVISDAAGGGDACGRKTTWPVCSKPKGNTAQGLCDMVGNVWVWLQDHFHDSYKGAPVDGSAWESPRGEFRDFRGGSWIDGARYSLAAERGGNAPGNPLAFTGVRPARSRP